MRAVRGGQRIARPTYKTVSKFCRKIIRMHITGDNVDPCLVKMRQILGGTLKNSAVSARVLALPKK